MHAHARGIPGRRELELYRGLADQLGKPWIIEEFGAQAPLARCTSKRAWAERLSTYVQLSGICTARMHSFTCNLRRRAHAHCCMSLEQA